MVITKILLSLFIALMPFVKMPSLPYFQRKIQYTEIVFIFLFLWVVYQAVKRGISLKRGIPNLYSLVFLLTTFAVSLFLAKPRLVDFIEYSGIAYLCVMYIAIVISVRDEIDWYYYLRVWAWTSASVCVLGLMGYAAACATGAPNSLVPTLNPQSELIFFPGAVHFDLRITSTFSNPNMLAAYLITGTAVILLLMKKRIKDGKKAGIYLALLCLHILAAALTKSRTASGVFLLATAGLFMLTPVRKYALLKISAILFTLLYSALALATVVIWVFPVQLNPLKMTTKNTEYYLQSEAGFKMWKDHPIFGVGPGRYNRNLADYFDWDKARESIFDPDDPLWRTKDPHSTYFGWAAETGIAGLLAILVLLGSHMGLAMKSGDTRIIAAGIIAFLLVGFSIDILPMRYLWFLLGMNGAYAYIVRPKIKV
ncbi:MAG: O-antigen ligase family protein [Candidatus Omnitrophica bacterium]|nr:O-antigen ligase family protein [Candidatus Omnitrophota bacterium]